MRIFIYACEEMYGGLHGIEMLRVIETNSFEVANEEGREMSFCVQDIYYSDGDLASICGVDDESEITEELYEENRNEYLCWTLWKVRDDVTLSTEELGNTAYYLGKEEFVELYCEPEPWEGR